VPNIRWTTFTLPPAVTAKDAAVAQVVRGVPALQSRLTDPLWEQSTP